MNIPTMKYFDILEILHSNGARYKDLLKIQLSMTGDTVIRSYMNCDDSAIYFIDGNPIPIKNIASIEIVK